MDDCGYRERGGSPVHFASRLPLSGQDREAKLFHNRGDRRIP